MLPGFVSATSWNMASRDPCSRGTWCKPRDTMHLRLFFGPTALLGRSIRILCCCVMDDDTNLLHLFRDITKQILTVSLDQHYKIMPLSSCIMLPWHLWPSGNIAQLRGIIFQCFLGTSHYFYNVVPLKTGMNTVQMSYKIYNSTLTVVSSHGLVKLKTV